MRIHSLLLVLLLIITSSFIPSKGTDYIGWSASNKLTWKDFQGKAERHSHHDALSHCGLSMDMGMTGGEMTFTVEAVFDRKQSWVKGDEPTDVLLAHEQLHFDIYERYARELRKELSDATFNGIPDDVTKKTSRIYKEVNDELLVAQRQYDKETDHSLVREKQLEWQERIKDELIELNAYSITAFNVEVMN
jgi:hypothetical protein